MAEQPTPLTGPALLAQVKKLTAEGLTKREVARACGYYTTGKDGRERIQSNEMVNAVLQAKGIELNEPALPVGPRGPQSPVVSKTGQIVISPIYVKEMGLESYTVMEIEMNPEKGEILLRKAPKEVQESYVPRKSYNRSSSNAEGSTEE